MAATTKIHEFIGSGPTAVDITSLHIRFKRADNDDSAEQPPDALNPVPIPTSGTNYSWRKHTKLYIQTTPANQISNLRYFSSGTALGTGIVHQALLNATYTQGSTSDETTSIGGTDTATYTSSSPLTVNSGVVIANPSTGYGTQNYLVQQMNIGTTASAGTSGTRTLTYRYDES